MHALKWFEKVLARIEGWLIVTILGLMVILTFVQVCLRGLYTHGHFQWANYLMGRLEWSEPFVRLLVLWLTFLGASLVTRENKHIKIDFFGYLLPHKWLSAVEIVMSMLCVLICALVLRAGIDYVKMEKEFGQILFLNFPSWTGGLIIPAGFVLIMFRFLIRGIEQGLEIFRGFKK